MAEGPRMTAAQLANKLLADEHPDVLRESVAWMAAELMEAEVAAQIGAEHGERTPERLTHRNGYRPRGWDTRVGEVELRDPPAAAGHLFPGSWSRAGGPSRPWSPSSRRPMSTGWHPAGGPAGRAAGIASMSKDQVSRLCRGLDEQVRVFRERPLEGRYPYLWLDAKVERVREPGGVRHKALVIAYGVHETRPAGGHRHRRRRGRDRGVLARVPARLARPRAGRRPVVHLRRPRGPAPGDRQGAWLPLAAVHRPFPARHARPRRQGPAAHDRRRDPRHLPGHQPGRGARSGWPRWSTSCAAAPKVAGLLEAAEAELLAFYELPREHWSKLRSTNPLERVNREIGRRTDVVGIFPNDAALLRLAGALLIEQNDEWLVARRYLSQESLALVLARRACHRGGRPAHPGLSPHDDPQLHHVVRLDCVRRYARWASSSRTGWANPSSRSSPNSTKLTP